MKHIVVALFIACCFTTVNVVAQSKSSGKPLASQTKKKSSMHPASKAQPKSKPAPEPEKLGSASDAGKFARGMANKMYNTEPVYGDKHKGLLVDINDWIAVKDDQGKLWYFIKLHLTWLEGTGGLGDWKTVDYKGTMIADEFGCSPLYFIDEKTEPSLFGLIKRARKMDEQTRDQARAKHDWLNNCVYLWEPGGCLE